MKDIIERADELSSTGYGLTLVKGILKAEGYSKEQINELNLTSSNKELDALAVMSFIIEHESLDRKTLAKKLSAQGLCSEKTGYHILSLMKFCKAYHELMSK